MPAGVPGLVHRATAEAPAIERQLDFPPRTGGELRTQSTEDLPRRNSRRGKKEVFLKTRFVLAAVALACVSVIAGVRCVERRCSDYRGYGLDLQRTGDRERTRSANHAGVHVVVQPEWALQPLRSTAHVRRIDRRAERAKSTSGRKTSSRARTETQSASASSSGSPYRRQRLRPLRKQRDVWRLHGSIDQATDAHRRRRTI